MKLIKKIGIVCALRQEAQGIIDTFNLIEASAPDPHFTMKLFTGKSKGLELALIVSGVDPRYQVDNIGTNAAVLSTFLLIEKFCPDILINPGTAGAFHSRGAKIGDVYLGQGLIRFHDRRTPVKKYAELSTGNFPAHSAPVLLNMLGLKSGIVSSGNSFDCSDVDNENLKAGNADLKDMEAGAIGWVAWTKGVPLLPLKAVTDFVEDSGTAEEQFIKNWQFACSNLTREVRKIVEFIEGRSLNEL